MSNDDDEDGEGEHSVIDMVLHFLSMPWKLLFAFIPPVDYCNGWVCFFFALGMIAVMTAVVGDLANLVGCTLNIGPEITAITFVALGTSLPDTFASKTAAVMDPYADASIGNVPRRIDSLVRHVRSFGRDKNPLPSELFSNRILKKLVV